ncbi:MAG TPA: ABC transporter permease [Thermoanaerobaculaceae bacterium]|nr:ABC transporter permease [Thermoanaerobaculaceae bacterium]
MTARLEPGAWTLRLRQLLAVTRLELRKCFRGRRLLGLALLNLAPVAVLLLGYFVHHQEVARAATPASLSQVYAVMFATWMLRVSVFFTAAALSIQLFRTEVLEKTLHYYLLAPVRREVMVAGKYLSASLASSLICGASAAAAYLALFGQLGHGMGRFFAEGPGVPHLLAYVGVTVIGCFGYGAVFALLGLLWRNPMLAVLALFGWESVLFLLPPALKAATVLFYLESLLPHRPPVGPLAILADPPPVLATIAGMAVFTLVVLALAGWRARRMEISYSTD